MRICSNASVSVQTPLCSQCVRRNLGIYEQARSAAPEALGMVDCARKALWLTQVLAEPTHARYAHAFALMRMTLFHTTTAPCAAASCVCA